MIVHMPRISGSRILLRHYLKRLRSPDLRHSMAVKKPLMRKKRWHSKPVNETKQVVEEFTLLRVSGDSWNGSKGQGTVQYDSKQHGDRP